MFKKVNISFQIKSDICPIFAGSCDPYHTCRCGDVGCVEMIFGDINTNGKLSCFASQRSNAVIGVFVVRISDGCISVLCPGVSNDNCAVL